MQDSRILSRYLFRSLFRTFVYFSTVFAVVIYLIQSFRFFKYIVQRQMGVGEFFSSTLLLLPHVLSYVIPFTFCIACAFAYYEMEQRRERIALQSLGFSTSFLARPMFYLAACALGIQFMLQTVSPYAVQRFLTQEQHFVQRIDFDILKAGQWNHVGPYTVYCTDSPVRQIFLYHANAHKEFFIVAQRGHLQDADPYTKHLSLEMGTQVVYDKETGDTAKLSFEGLQLDLPWKRPEIKKRDFFLSQTIPQLWNMGAYRVLGVRVAKILLPLLGALWLRWWMFRYRYGYVLGGMGSCLMCFGVLFGMG